VWQGAVVAVVVLAIEAHATVQMLPAMQDRPVPDKLDKTVKTKAPMVVVVAAAAATAVMAAR
jgi:hypothetical protein